MKNVKFKKKIAKIADTLISDGYATTFADDYEAIAVKIEKATARLSKLVAKCEAAGEADIVAILSGVLDPMETLAVSMATFHPDDWLAGLELAVEERETARSALPMPYQAALMAEFDKEAQKRPPVTLSLKLNTSQMRATVAKMQDAISEAKGAAYVGFADGTHWPMFPAEKTSGHTVSFGLGDKRVNAYVTGQSRRFDNLSPEDAAALDAFWSERIRRHGPRPGCSLGTLGLAA